MQIQHRICRQSFARSLAWAVSIAALLGVSLPARAETQYYDFDGSVFTNPFNFFPIDKFASFYDFSGNTLDVGSSAAGSFSAFAGAWTKLDGLNLGDGGTGNGTANVSGGRIDLGGDTNRLQVGNWGTGSMTVSAGGLVDATVNAGACVLHCYNFVGNAAGSTGTLTVTGAGSEVRTVRNFTVAEAAVYSPFGTPGGTTNGFVNVLDGGSLRTEGAWISTGPQGPNALGTERTFATIVIDGPGSQWVVTRNSIDNATANFSAATSSNAQATINITGGGKLIVDGTGSVGPFDGINLGSNGGRADMTVSGVGSEVRIDHAANPFINVGRSGATGQGSFNVLDGASASAMLVSVGRDGALGTMLIDGSGSLMTLSGVGTPGVSSTAVAFVGRDGGNGVATISNGGRLFITDGGADSRLVNAPRMIVGLGGGTGSLTIDGTGSKVEIVSTSLAPDPGVADNFNPFMSIGFDSGSSGQLTVSNGGKVLLTGNAAASFADQRYTVLRIGGSSLGVGGNGQALVTGLGSEVQLSGTDAFVGVGYGAGSVGRLDIADHGQVASKFLIVGEAGASGTLSIDGAGSLMTLSGVGTPGVAGTAGATVGRDGGNGNVTVSNGGRLFITDGGADSRPTVNSHGSLFIGQGAGGVGTLTINGSGSTVEIVSTSLGLDPGVPDNYNPYLSVGRENGSSGQLLISNGGKLLMAGNALSTVTDSRGTSLVIGGYNDVANGGTGIAVVSGTGSEVRLTGIDTFVGVGFGPLSSGSLTVQDDASLSAIGMNVGRSGGVGVLTVDNSTLSFSGQQTGSTLSGAFLAIGRSGGNGTASIQNSSVVTLTNMGSAGASLALGGTGPGPLGDGTLTVSGGSRINIIAAPGRAFFSVGRDGTGRAVIEGGSAIDVGDGSVYVGRLASGVGDLRLRTGSTVSAGYVGVGSTPGVDTGSGKLFVSDDSSVTATTVEIGVNGLLGGNEGTINGNLIVRGTLSPGESPGRMIIHGSIQTENEAKIILDVASDGHGGFLTDELILTLGSSFEFGASTKVVFNFLGDADPNAFGASGKFDMDTFMLSRDGSVDSGLSTVFAPGTDWASYFTSTQFGAQSDAYDVTELALSADGSFGVVAVPVPEPAEWTLMLVGLALLSSLSSARARSRDARR